MGMVQWLPQGREVFNPFIKSPRAERMSCGDITTYCQLVLDIFSGQAFHHALLNSK